MAHEIEVYGDDDGFMLLGNSADIRQALAELQIEENHTIDIGKAAILKNAHRAVKLFEIMQKHSGRWVKFTKDSAEKAQKYGLLRNKSTGNFMGVIGQAGKSGIKGNVQFKAMAGVFTPDKVANIEMLMLTLALEQAMKEMTDYLKQIDAKVDQVLRQQKNAELAKFLSVAGLVMEAENELQHIGSLSDATWDQLSNSAQTVNEVQQYSLLQLKDITEKITSAADTRSAKDVLTTVRPRIGEWLAVAADCLRMRDRIDMLKVQRFIDMGIEPDLLSKHRFVITENRRARYRSLTDTTANLQQAVKNVVQGKDDTMRVILLPMDAPVVVREGNAIASALARFDKALGKEYAVPRFNEKQWDQAMGEVGQAIADGTGQLMHQAEGFFGEGTKQIGNVANEAGDQIKKVFGNFPKLW
ncbi:hypothetical protein [Bifidobacterium pseudolongum]|uniref:hypothetical protein n=1 Tax=Bifidobacterium pseudolongum TaxID=1694 RepID=UPI001020E1F6|nr:hypothetical protein [Bifidobacterium pseudolongum]RYQ66653.1 hypothetical protein PG2109B_0696 [Bifidobacterium pseudolongum subsp. globosum]